MHKGTKRKKVEHIHLVEAAVGVRFTTVKVAGLNYNRIQYRRWRRVKPFQLKGRKELRHIAICRIRPTLTCIYR